MFVTALPRCPSFHPPPPTAGLNVSLFCRRDPLPAVGHQGLCERQKRPDAVRRGQIHQLGSLQHRQRQRRHGNHSVSDRRSYGHCMCYQGRVA